MVNVEYRLAPEHKFPAQMDDGVCATKWVLENKQTIGKYQLYVICIPLLFKVGRLSCLFSCLMFSFINELCCYMFHSCVNVCTDVKNITVARPSLSQNCLKENRKKFEYMYHQSTSNQS